MKKLISVLLALVMALSLCATAWADNPVLSGTCGAAGNEANVSWALADEDGDDNYTLTISGTGAMADFSGWQSQPWCKAGIEIARITKVVIDDGVTAIGSSAFDGVNGVTEYIIGKDVTTIGGFAFCLYSTTTLTLDNNNTNFKIVDGVLFNADGTKLIAYPGGAALIAEYTIPSTVTEIGAGSFAGADMQKLVVPSSVTKVPQWTFSGCTVAYIEFHMKEIPGDQFANLPNLKELRFSSEVNTIRRQAFRHDKNGALEKVTFAGPKMPLLGTPQSNNDWYGQLFADQKKLTTVDLSNCETVSEVKPFAFKGTDSSMIVFYLSNEANANGLKNSVNAYDESNAVFAVLNGGSIPGDKGYYEDTGKLTTPAKTGFDFGGWYANADFSGGKVENPVVGSTYYAKWVSKKCTVSFDPDGGSTVPAQNVDYNAEATAPATPPTKTGYTFAGWFAPGANTVFDFVNTPITDDITLIAHWTANQYNVTFNSDGGSTVPTQTVNHNTKVTKPTDPTKSGYVFDGWFDAQGNKFDFNTVVTGNVTLKAHWTLKTNNIGPAKNPYVKDNTKSDTKTDGKTVKSGDTFDPGVALYAGMALVSAAGMAWTVRKRGE